MVRILHLLVFVALLVFLAGCGPPSIVIGGKAQKVESTKIVFANDDPRLEYLIYVPPPERLFSGAGHWVYVVQQTQNPARASVRDSTFAMLQIETAHTTPVEGPVGWVTFHYYTLLRGRLVSSRQDAFTMFVVPADQGKARLIRLTGRNL